MLQHGYYGYYTTLFPLIRYTFQDCHWSVETTFSELMIHAGQAGLRLTAFNRVERGGWGQSVTHITALNITESLTTNQEYYDTMQNNNPRIQELNSRIQRLNEESNRRIEEVKLLDIL